LRFCFNKALEFALACSSWFPDFGKIESAVRAGVNADFARMKAIHQNDDENAGWQGENR
jgi:hypothetical protein